MKVRQTAAWSFFSAVLLSLWVLVPEGVASTQKGFKKSLESSQNLVNTQDQILSLFKQGDVTGAGKVCMEQKSTDSVSFCKLRPPELKKLQRQLLKMYTVPADVRLRNEKEFPKVWVDAWEDPRRALGVGVPRHIKRESQNYLIPMFALPSLVFFEGDSENISRLNTAIGYWKSGKNEIAYELLGEMLKKLRKADKNDLERSLVYLTRAFLDLDFLARVQSGLVKTEASAKFWKVRARGDFFQGIGSPDLSAFVSSVDQSFDAEIYVATMENALFLEDQGASPIAPPPVRDSRRTLSPLKWIRSVAPMALFNLMVLSRVKGQFSKAFTAAEKLEGVAEKMGDELDEVTAQVLNVMTNSDRPSVAKPIFLRPSHIKDLVALSFLVRAAASVQAKDPLKTLMFADETIRRSHSVSLVAIGFGLMANVYYDLRNLHWARRTYAWSEIMDPRLFDLFPSTLLWGAEAAFWQGDHDVARRAFTLFRQKVSDRKYGPLASLRLLQLDLLEGHHDTAKSRITHLITHYGNSVIAADVKVLDFCWNSDKLTRRVLRHEYMLVKEMIKNAPLDLQEQAEACLLFADLRFARNSENPGSGMEIHQEAKAQLRRIGSFRKRFPKSPFLALLDRRIAFLKLSPIFADLEQNHCVAVVDFYLANEELLWKSAAKKEPVPVAGMRWSAADMKKTIRCAAYLGKDDVWGKIRSRGDVDDSKLQQALLQLRLGGKGTLKNLLRKVVERHGWDILEEAQRSIDLNSAALVNEEQFWKMLALGEVVEREAGLAADNGFYELPLMAAMSDSELLRSELKCAWAQKALRLRPEQKELRNKRILSVPESQWLSALLEDGVQKETKCRFWLARLFVQLASQKPSKETDEGILWPFIDEVGVLNEPEIAMSLAKRSYQDNEENFDKVVEVFSEIADNATDGNYRRAAREWLRVNEDGFKRSFW